MIEFIQANSALVLAILLAVSELLAVIPFFKSNSIAQLVLNTVMTLLGKKPQA